jgi:hypothetical protein
MFLTLRVCPKPRIIETQALGPLFPSLKPVKLAFRYAGMVCYGMLWYGMVWYVCSLKYFYEKNSMMTIT